MLIYNYRKEFVGIDESDLKALGFSDLSQLRNESADFADLFVKTPGFVHNFKHVHWIDFVTCAEGSEDSKVIIHANGKNFRSTLDIKTAYLVDNPSQKAYIINLVNLRALTHIENEQIAGDILEKPAPRVSTDSAAIFNTPDFSSSFEDDKHTKVVATEEATEEEAEITHDPYEASQTDTLDQLDANPKVIKDIYEDIPIDLGDDLIEMDEIVESDIEEEPDTPEEPVKEPLPPIYTQKLNVGSDYVYDPHLASDELGLPVDLIEEFIQDFISQANDFKDDLYSSLNDGNTDNVKILSHKLKGVAANLRIEDAFEVLTTINTSDNQDEIKTNIDTLYIIIDKLSGKAVQKAAPVEAVDEEVSYDEEEDDDLVLSFKDDLEAPEVEAPKEESIDEQQTIDDSEVPQKIEMPELADDNFLTSDETPQEIEEIVLHEDIDDIEDLTEITLDAEVENIDEISLSTNYDKAKAASEIGIDAQSFETLFDDFMVEGNNACAQINNAIEQGNDNSWRQAAIRLKGMSDNMRIHDFTTELETIIHTKDSNTAKEAIDAISAKLEQISSREV